METEFKCSICFEVKPINQFYLNKKTGKRKGTRCKTCNNKLQYEQEKNNPNRLEYLERNKEARKEQRKEYVKRVRVTPEYKEKRRIYDANYRKSDKYKPKRVNKHISELNKQLKAAKLRDRKRFLNELNKELKRNNYQPIADKYNTLNLSHEIEWKDIEGYEGRYRISNHGDVYSCLTNKVLKPIFCKTHGYYKINLYGIDGDRITHKIHRLVAKAFMLNKFNKQEVNHIDSNRINNVVTNLEWVTRQENVDHRICNHLNLINNESK